MFMSYTLWYLPGNIYIPIIPGVLCSRAEVRRSFITTTAREESQARSHHKGATGRVRTGDQRLPVLSHCQLGQDIRVYNVGCIKHKMYVT